MSVVFPFSQTTMPIEHVEWEKLGNPTSGSASPGKRKLVSGRSQEHYQKTKGFKNTSLAINVFSPPSCLQNNVLGSFLSLGWKKEKELIISFIEIGFPWFLCYSFCFSSFLFLWKGKSGFFSSEKGSETIVEFIYE